ncbi:MAG: hypothetical protein AAFX94_01750 [Myxococcota bacterium]
MTWKKFETIEKIVKAAEQDGSVVRCTFVCPVSSSEVASSAALVRGEGLSDITGDRGGLTSQLKDSFTRAVSSAFGAAFLLNRSKSSSGEEPSRYSEDERKLAIYRAFESISSRFLWHGEKGQWVSALAVPDLATEFSLQLCRAPIESRYDETVTARMMVEMATIDHRLADAERALLETFLTDDTGTLDELLKRPPLRVTELGETTPGPVRETMLMMVWALVVIDERIHDNEIDLIQTFARGLAVDEERSRALKGYAAEFAVDRALTTAYAGGERDDLEYASARSLATKLGLSRAEADRLDVRARKRLAIY